MHGDNLIAVICWQNDMIATRHCRKA